MIVQAVAVVQRAMRQADPAEVMAEMGFGEVELVSSFAVSMSGTHRLVCFVLLKSNRRDSPTRVCEIINHLQVHRFADDWPMIVSTDVRAA